MAGVDCTLNGANRSDGVLGGVGRGGGVFHTPYPLVLARKTRENSFSQESLTPASAPQATIYT